jgi:2-oxo-3-hexenedioate decarboxylase
MSTRGDERDLKAIAAEVISSLADHRQIPAFSLSPGGLTVADAYRLTPLLRATFEARGEKITGRKIGFTNRRMWAAHGVEAPIWSYCTDRTTYELKNAPPQRVRDFAEPRIESEIMLGLGKAPLPDMAEPVLLDCVEWIALGYEIVQSIFPSWKFAASDTIAANGSTVYCLSETATRSRRARRLGNRNWPTSASSSIAMES